MARAHNRILSIRRQNEKCQESRTRGILQNNSFIPWEASEKRVPLTTEITFFPQISLVFEQLTQFTVSDYSLQGSLNSTCKLQRVTRRDNRAELLVHFLARRVANSHLILQLLVDTRLIANEVETFLCFV